ncbi:MAG: hypothetical protein IIZ51_08585 [Lachnospiraceae bacterium]|nr:hypothetical protein [Lachnospiraceae bacterium]MBQ4309065.1 hypothetical protein [Lachnospiraceae bacterium]
MKDRFEKDEIRTVVRRALRYLEFRAEDGPPGKVLVLFPAGACEAKELIAEYVLSGYADDAVFCFESSDDIPDAARGMDDLRIVSEDRPREAGRIYGDLSRFDRVEICSPSVSFMKRLASGGDDRMVRAASSFFMTGRPCVIRTPYRPDRLRPGRFARELKQLYEDLWDMGVSFAGMTPEPAGRTESTADLVTEKDVIDAHQRNISRIICGPKAVITPLAAEAARERSIQIIFGKEDHSNEHTGK